MAPIDTNLICTIAIVWRYNGADGTADAIEALCDEVDRLRDLLAKALPWIDPNDRHEDYLLTVAIREALGEPT
mgnify:CR=1 FL=1